MKNKTLVIILLGIIFITGCHSFYRINVDELQNINENNIVQIKLESGEVIRIKNIRETSLLNNQELEFIKYTSATYKADSTRLVYSLNEIKDIRVEKLDVGKTFFSTMWISVGVAVLVFAIIWHNG